ncbi:unnamed protein product [Linum trigynum]|uniref:Uncharacterized protein n=1 Tax=Linum trigynum TaxID=586398 RepID=A0AAV2FCE3_9ROSI
MGRAPCCDKANVKKGPWSPEEDAKLKSYIDHNGTGGNWIALPQKIGLKRCGKSCRLRWLNYLRPNIKHGGFSEEEDNLICSLYISIGSRWSIIAAQLPGRTDNDIKNYWNTRLKKKLLGKQQRKDHHHHRRLKSTNTTTAAPPNHQHDLAAAPISSQLAAPDSSDNSTTTVHDSLVVDLPHHHYWPTAATAALPPIPYSSEEPRLNDHASIRKLLIKLGGRFSNCSTSHHQHQLIVPETTTVPLFQAASASLEGSEALGRHHYCNMDDGGVLLEMLQGNTTSHRDDGEDADHERLEYGLEFLLSGEQQGIMSNGEPSDQLVYDEHNINHSPFQGGYHNAFDELRPYPQQAGGSM